MAAVKWRRFSDVAAGVANSHGRQGMGVLWRARGTPTSPVAPSTSVISSHVHNFISSLPSATSVRGTSMEHLAIGRVEIQSAKFHDRVSRKGLQAHAICGSCSAPLSAPVASIYPFPDSAITCSGCGAVDSLVVVGFGANSTRGPGGDAGQ